jgi:hypothetical protein
MAQINVDPKAQLEFARDLNREVQLIRQRHEDVGRHLRELASAGVWSDVAQAEYRKQFDRASETIATLVKDAKAYCEYLERQAALGERYLRLGQRRI